MTIEFHYPGNPSASMSTRVYMTSGDELEIQAGDNVTFGPGFHAETGSKLTAIATGYNCLYGDQCE